MGFSLVVVSRGYSPAVLQGLLIVVASLVKRGLQGVWASVVGALSPRAKPQQSWHMGLATLPHVGSFQMRDRTRVSCIGRRILLSLSHQGSPRKSF